MQTLRSFPQSNTAQD